MEYEGRKVDVDNMKIVFDLLDAVVERVFYWILDEQKLQNS